MKRIKKAVSIILATAVMVAILMTTAFAVSYKSTDATQNYPIKGATLVTLGDSVTAFGGWQDVITSKCGATVINSGTGGTGIKNGLEQFQAKVSKYSPDFCTIMYGFNDVSYFTIAQYKTFLLSFVKKCRAIDVIPILITQHCANEDIWYTKYPDRTYRDGLSINGIMNDFATAAREVAAENNVSLMDWNEYSSSLDVTTILNGGNDGVHLSDAGKQELGNFAADFFNTNFPGDAATAEKTTSVKPQTQMLFDFNEQTVPENVYNNGLASGDDKYTFEISDDASAGNNALKITTTNNSSDSIRFSFDSMPENCIGFRFKINSAYTNLRIIGFNDKTATANANRIFNASNIEYYEKRVWTVVDVNFADYPMTSGSLDDIESFAILTTTFGANYLIYFDDIEWLIDPNSSSVTTTTTKVTTKPTTTTTTSTTTKPTTTSTTTKPTTSTTTTTTTTTKPTTSTTTTTTTTKPTTSTTTTKPVTTTTTVVPTQPTTEKIIYGDADDSGKVNVADLLTIKKNMVKIKVNINIKNADVNFDGDCNLIDMLMIKKYIVGIKIAPWD